MNFDLRHPSYLGATGPDIYGAALDIIEWGDKLGFDRVGFGEHHQSEDGYIPSPLVFAAAVGARTTQIRIRISVLLAQLYNPLRLAEDAAVADLCCGGRLDLGLGVGYVEADFDAFGKDFHRRGANMEELVPLLRKAWTGEPFEHNGHTVRVTPKPHQDPMPIFLGGATRRSIDRAARLGDGFFAPGMERPWEHYRKVSQEIGKTDPGPFPPRGPIFLWVTTGDTDAEWEYLAPHIRHQINSYAEWTTTGLGKASGPFVPTGEIENLKQDGAYQVVTPDEAIELAHELGPEGELHFNPLLAGIDPDRAWKMLADFERHVLPELSQP
jgi:alkanesulfonate monooxygenase SsuD/methylene tetrahydromethanopterin reductase-like flavin-dependent oxidoreductase (luciferase family)